MPPTIVRFGDKPFFRIEGRLKCWRTPLTEHFVDAVDKLLGQPVP